MNTKVFLKEKLGNFKIYIISIAKEDPELIKWCQGIDTNKEDNIVKFVGWIIEGIKPIINNKQLVCSKLLLKSGVPTSHLSKYTTQEIDKTYDYMKMFSDIC